MNNPTLGVLYSCHKCGLRDVEVKLLARTNETIVRWMNDVMARALSADHDRRSPHCHITKLDEIKIPMPPGTGKVGGVVEN